MTEKNEEQTATLLFSQNAIKMVRVTDTHITVLYGDGGEPIFIHKDDVLFQFHHDYFSNLVKENLAGKMLGS